MTITFTTQRSKFCIRVATGEIVAVGSRRASAQKKVNEKLGGMYTVFPSSLHVMFLDEYLQLISKGSCKS